MTSDPIAAHVAQWLDVHGRDDLDVDAFVDLASRYVTAPTIDALDAACELVLSVVNEHAPRTRVPVYVETLAGMLVERERLLAWYVELRSEL